MDQKNISSDFKQFSSIENPSSKHLAQLKKYGYISDQEIEW